MLSEIALMIVFFAAGASYGRISIKKWFDVEIEKIRKECTDAINEAEKQTSKVKQDALDILNQTKALAKKYGYTEEKKDIK